jgi:hypothetical protein
MTNRQEKEPEFKARTKLQTSGFCRSVVEAVALLGSYAAEGGILFTTS